MITVSNPTSLERKEEVVTLASTWFSYLQVFKTRIQSPIRSQLNNNILNSL